MPLLHAALRRCADSAKNMSSPPQPSTAHIQGGCTYRYRTATIGFLPATALRSLTPRGHAGDILSMLTPMRSHTATAGWHISPLCRLSCEDRIRTYDLLVMSQMSFQTAPPRDIAQSLIIATARPHSKHKHKGFCNRTASL